MKIFNLSTQQQEHRQEHQVSDMDAFAVKENNSDDTSTMSTVSEGSNGSESNAITSAKAATSPSKSALSGLLDSCDLQNVYYTVVGGQRNRGNSDNKEKTNTKAKESDKSSKVYMKKKKKKHGSRASGIQRKQKRSSSEDSSQRRAAAVVSDEEEEEEEKEAAPELSLEELRYRLLATSRKLLRSRGFSIRQQLQDLLMEESATLLQAQIRGLLARTVYQELLATEKERLRVEKERRRALRDRLVAAQVIQIFYRMRYQRRSEAASCIQRHLVTRTEYYRNYRLGACIMIQSVLRRALVQIHMSKRYPTIFVRPEPPQNMILTEKSAAALKLQAAVRRFLAYRQFQRVRQGVIALQSASRGLSTRNELLHTEYDEQKDNEQVPSEVTGEDDESEYEDEDDDDDDDDSEDDAEEESLVTYDDLPIEELDDEDRHRDGWFEELLQDIVGDFEDTWKEMTVSTPSVGNKTNKTKSNGSRKLKSSRQRGKR
ncbi:unnamed protein product [Cylindrotheca closterium]|uniref:Uncharacterized protein n=1 Tax=Cylindrotheca closterium TaxID=2856 RepID=A0AAD2CJ79_9STRA|nr:unnamed protein product [Cylindrotheca closterium]